MRLAIAILAYALTGCGFFEASSAKCRSGTDDDFCVKRATDGGPRDSGSAGATGQDGGAAGDGSAGNAGNGGVGGSGAGGNGGAGVGGVAPDGGTTCENNTDCEGATPHCVEATGECVACLVDTHCASLDEPECDDHTCAPCTSNTACEGRGDTQLCDTVAGATQGACVECIGNSDCMQATASVCDAVSRTCVGCDDNPGCAHIAGLNVCESGACVECTAETEDECGGKVCEHDTFSCSTRDRANASICETCEWDSDCPTGNLAIDQRDYRCVQMQFQSSAHGSYCLKTFTSGCARPYTVRVDDAVSTSGAASDDYCGIDQAATTCEAVRAIGTDCPGGQNSECGATGLDDGTCGTVGGAANLCSYPCSDTAQCPSGRACDAPITAYCH